MRKLIATIVCLLLAVMFTTSGFATEKAKADKAGKKTAMTEENKPADHCEINKDGKKVLLAEGKDRKECKKKGGKWVRAKEKTKCDGRHEGHEGHEGHDDAENHEGHDHE